MHRTLLPWSRSSARFLLCLASCCLVTATRPFAAEDDRPGTLGEALKQGQVSVSLRYRFESVGDDAPAVADKDANASTLRTTVAYRSAGFRGFSLFAEFEDVTDIGLEDQHQNGGAGSLTNGVTDRPSIPDPDLTELNQAYLRYSGLPDTHITAGRQELSLGDERFVGPVGWRQNHQSFDAVSLTQGSVPRTRLTYVFVANVNRVFGDNQGLAGHLLDAAVAIGATGHLTPYLYTLDYDAAANAALSTTTFGARWQDAPKCGGGWSIPYHLELARQTDGGDNPTDVDAGYLRVEVGGKRERWWVSAGYERLEGNATEGRFITPLATLHKFNGWADKFRATPTDGLEDLYASAGGKWRQFSGLLAYHAFAADSTDVDYGTELDAQVLYDAPWKQTFGLTLARYDADAFAADTDKIWVWTGYSF